MTTMRRQDSRSHHGALAVFKGKGRVLYVRSLVGGEALLPVRPAPEV